MGQNEKEEQYKHLAETDIKSLRNIVWEKLNLRPMGFIDLPYRGRGQDKMTDDQKRRQLIPFEATGGEVWSWSKACYPLKVTNIRYKKEPRPGNDLQARPQIGELVAFSSWKLPRLAMIYDIIPSGIKIREIVVGYVTPQNAPDGRPVETVYTSLQEHNETHEGTLVWTRALWKVIPDPTFMQELNGWFAHWTINEAPRRQARDANQLPSPPRRRARVERRRHDHQEILRAEAQPI